MKQANTKLFIMFLMGILFSTFTVFAATITVNTGFSQGAVQYVQKIVLKSSVGATTGLILDANSSTYKLEVNGSIKTSQDIDINGLVKRADGSIGSGGIDNEFGLVDSDDNVIAVKDIDNKYKYGGQGLVIDSNKNVGIGIDNPSVRLDVNGTGKFNGLCLGSNCISAWSSAGAAPVWSTGTSKIYYTGGNVGIGTSTPTVKLEVVGDVISSGNTTIIGNLYTKPLLTEYYFSGIVSSSSFGRCYCDIDTTEKDCPNGFLKQMSSPCADYATEDGGHALYYGRPTNQYNYGLLVNSNGITIGSNNGLTLPIQIIGNLKITTETATGNCAGGEIRYISPNFRGCTTTNTRAKLNS